MTPANTPFVGHDRPPHYRSMCHTISEISFSFSLVAEEKASRLVLSKAPVRGMKGKRNDCTGQYGFIRFFGLKCNIMPADFSNQIPELINGGL